MHPACQLSPWALLIHLCVTLTHPLDLDFTILTQIWQCPYLSAPSTSALFEYIIKVVKAAPEEEGLQYDMTQHLMLPETWCGWNIIILTGFSYNLGWYDAAVEYAISGPYRMRGAPNYSYQMYCLLIPCLILEKRLLLIQNICIYKIYSESCHQLLDHDNHWKDSTFCLEQIFHFHGI